MPCRPNVSNFLGEARQQQQHGFYCNSFGAIFLHSNSRCRSALLVNCCKNKHKLCIELLKGNPYTHDLQDIERWKGDKTRIYLHLNVGTILVLHEYYTVFQRVCIPKWIGLNTCSIKYLVFTLALSHASFVIWQELERNFRHDL